MRVFGEVEGVIRAAQGIFEIAEHGIDSPELRQLDAGFATAGDCAVVDSADAADRREAAQAIRDHGQRQSQGFGRELVLSQ